MNRFAYYEKMKTLAREVRSQYGLTTPRVLRADLRRIYRDQGIKIDLWPLPGCRTKFKKLRGAYFADDLGSTVMIVRGLPAEPTIFTMGHELKHHLADRHLMLSYCDASNINEPIEIGAEVFAAELIFPDEDFRTLLGDMGVGSGQCKPENIVRLKHDTQSTLSYAGMVKKADFLGLSAPGALEKIRWKKLEEQIYGVPFYKATRGSRGQWN